MGGLRWPKGTRRLVFWIQVLYLGVLAGIGWAYFTGGLPDWLSHPLGTGLRLPPAVLFFGALGGVLISLAGVFEHMYDWDERYFFWHVARPFVGASVAVVAVLILQSGILAVGVQPTDQNPGGAKDLLYYVVAFVVGYREEAFRGMVKKAADLILTSPAVGLPPVVSSIDPDHGPVAGPQTVTIAGSGLTGTQVVRFGPAKAEFVVDSDGEITATVPQSDVASRVSVLVVTPRGAAVAVQLYAYE